MKKGGPPPPDLERHFLKSSLAPSSWASPEIYLYTFVYICTGLYIMYILCTYNNMISNLGDVQPTQMTTIVPQIEISNKS